MPSAVITRKSQVTIPKTIRNQVRLHVGDRVNFVVRDGEIVLKPPPQSILDLQGSVQPHEKPEDFEHIRRTVKERRAEKAIEGG